MKSGARNRSSSTSGTASRAAALVQARRAPRRSGDAYEQEADRVAGVVAAGGRASAISRLASRAAPQFQAEAGEADEEIQAKSEQRTAEDEKKKGAQQEVRPPPERKELPTVQRQAETAEEETGEADQADADEEPVQASPEPGAARREAGKRRFPASLENVDRKLAESRGRGSPLDGGTRTLMERGFGADFGAVRVHTGADAMAMNRDLKAQAFTRGNDIFFNAGKFEPRSQRGRNLLAHELTHVVQQGAAQQKLPAGADKAGPSFAPIGGEKAAPPRPAAEETAGAKVAAPTKPAAAAVSSGKGEAGGERRAPSPAQAGRPRAGGESLPDAAAPRRLGAVGEFLQRTSRAAFSTKAAAVGRLAMAAKTKEPATAKLAQAEQAVVPPAQEGMSWTRADQVDAVDRAAAPAPDQGMARTRFRAALSGAVPATLEEMDRFKEEGKGRVVGQAVREVVATDTQAVEGTYGAMEKAPSGPAPEGAPGEIPAVDAAPETVALEMGEGVVGEVQPEHADLSEFGRQSDDLLAKEEIKAEQLEMVDEGDLAEANRERKAIKDKVRQAPGDVAAFGQAQRQETSRELQKEELEGSRQMGGARRRELHGARDRQAKVKSALEARREAVAAHINAVYEKASATVRQKLADLEKKSLAAFDDGQQRAARSFEDGVKRRMDAFKAQRYDVVGGSLLWAKDKLFGMEDMPEVAEIFASERERFVAAVDALIDGITADNRRVVQECREIVAAARQEIGKFVRGLGPELRKTGQEALKDMQGRLEALDREIDAKAEALMQALAARREAAIKAIDDRIAKMKEEMSGLVSRLGGLLLDAMLKFFTWALKKAGYANGQLIGIINKGKAVIKKIVSDPIGFILNLVQAVKDGIGLFWTNIRKHLVGGLMNWLTGAMADVPIQLPEKWDLKGIINLVLQILSLTWASIRAKLVKRLGEKAVRVAETKVGIVKQLVVDGPMALWDMLKDKAEEIKQQVMDGIRGWAMFELVKQGIVKLVSFLNPAGAIVQAILAIYNTIMFFVENWERIVDFAKSVLNSIADIALGRLAAAAQLVERALGMTVPIILGFLARLLGLGGIGKTVAGIVKKIRKPIDKVVNKAIAAIVRMAKKLLTKAGGALKKAKEKVVAWWKSKVKFKAKDGEKHTIFIKKSGKHCKVMVASEDPKEVKTHVAAMKNTSSPEEHQRAVNKAEETTRLIEPIRVFSHGSNKDLAETVREVQVEMAGHLAKLGGDVDGSLPEKADWDPPKNSESGKQPNDVSVSMLTSKNVEKGSEPPKGEGEKSKTTGWKELYKARLTLNHPEAGKRKTGEWVQMHLINEHLGGEGKSFNLVPGPKAINSGYMLAFESTVKKLVDKKDEKNKHNVLWVSSKVTYHSGKDSAYASEVKMRAGLCKTDGKQSARKLTWEKDKRELLIADVSLPKPELDQEKTVVSLNHSSGTSLKNALPGLHYSIAAIKRNRLYKGEEDFLEKVSADLAETQGGEKKEHRKQLKENVTNHLDRDDIAGKKDFRLTMDRST